MRYTGNGDTDNASFTIEGDQLKTAAEFNYEAKDEYTIRVKGTDSGGLSIEKTFTLNVTDGPDTPSEILLSNSTVDENQKKGATVGNLGAMDEDAGEKHTYRLVDIPVDPDPENPNAEILPSDNSFFAISGTTLKTNAILDFEAKSAYTINVEVTDKDKRTYQQLMVIGVNDTNDAPTGLTLDRSEVAEGLAKGTEVGTLLPADPDAGDTHTYRISGGKDAKLFAIVDNKLVTNAVFDREEKQLLDVDVTVTDSGKETYIATFEITVLDVNDAPTDITLDNDTIAENQPADTVVGKFTLVDPDLDDDATTGGGTGQFDFTEGLVAYYPFNGNAKDESGNGHDGEVNGLHLTADRFGEQSKAYSFDGMMTIMLNLIKQFPIHLLDRLFLRGLSNDSTQAQRQAMAGMMVLFQNSSNTKYRDGLFHEQSVRTIVGHMTE